MQVLVNLVDEYLTTESIGDWVIVEMRVSGIGKICRMGKIVSMSRMQPFEDNHEMLYRIHMLQVPLSHLVVHTTLPSKDGCFGSKEKVQNYFRDVQAKEVAARDELHRRRTIEAMLTNNNSLLRRVQLEQRLQEFRLLEW